MKTASNNLRIIQNEYNKAMKELGIYCRKRGISKSMHEKMKEHAIESADPFGQLSFGEVNEKIIENIYEITRRGQKRKRKS